MPLTTAEDCSIDIFKLTIEEALKYTQIKSDYDGAYVALYPCAQYISFCALHKS